MTHRPETRKRPTIPTAPWTWYAVVVALVLGFIIGGAL